MARFSPVLARNLALLATARASTFSPSLERDRLLQHLVADLVAARNAAGMTQD